MEHHSDTQHPVRPVPKDEDIFSVYKFLEKIKVNHHYLRGFFTGMNTERLKRKEKAGVLFNKVLFEDVVSGKFIMFRGRIGHQPSH